MMLAGCTSCRIYEGGRKGRMGGAVIGVGVGRVCIYMSWRRFTCIDLGILSDLAD